MKILNAEDIFKPSSLKKASALSFKSLLMRILRFVVSVMMAPPSAGQDSKITRQGKLAHFCAQSQCHAHKSHEVRLVRAKGREPRSLLSVGEVESQKFRRKPESGAPAGMTEKAKVACQLRLALAAWACGGLAGTAADCLSRQASCRRRWRNPLRSAEGRGLRAPGPHLTLRAAPRLGFRSLNRHLRQSAVLPFPCWA